MKLEFERRAIQVEIGREQYERVRAIIGERLYVKPRCVRVFMSEATRAADARVMAQL